MNLTDIKYIKPLMERHGFKFSKSLGQNFLIEPSVCPKMTEISCVSDDMGIIEIGTGIGTLTVELAKKADKVVTFEVDASLYPVHAETLSQFKNIAVIHQDIMKADLRKIIEENFSPNQKIAVCANLPYYITTPVLMFLLESGIDFCNITVMIQKEVADRLCADTSSKEAGAITYAVRYYGKAEKCFDVPNTFFLPPPKVNSAVIKITSDDTLSRSITDKKIFFSIVKAGFAQRRKRFVNAVSSGTGINKDFILEFLRENSIDENIRMEQMTLSDIVKLSNEIKKQS